MKEPKRKAKKAAVEPILASKVWLSDTGKAKGLVTDRMYKGLCVECGGPLGQGFWGEICEQCKSAYPIVTNIGEADNAWQWAVIQTHPIYLGLAYNAVRIGIHERKGTRYIGSFDSMHEAGWIAERDRERSLNATASYYGYR